MSVPISQILTITSYVIKQKLKGRKKYPLVLMLEPLLRCNLKCKGCGKVQHPAEILKKELSFEECMDAARQCNTPVISIPGGEPLLHSDMPRIVDAFEKQKKYVYLCTNALLLKEKLSDYHPSKYLTFSVHIDGPEKYHDDITGLQGAYKKATEAIKDAVKKGFRVTTNSTFFDMHDPLLVRSFFDDMTQLGVESMMFSPGFNYQNASDQDHFLPRKETHRFFRALLNNPKKEWKFNHSPLFLEFLCGTKDFECMPWGNPCYSVLGWQSPCYLIEDRYFKTYEELMKETTWEKFGQKSENPECVNCMVHCGHEPSIVDYTFGSWKGFFDTVRSAIKGPNIPKP